MLFFVICVSDGSIGFVDRFIYFAITDFMLSSLYFQFQFLNE